MKICLIHTAELNDKHKDFVSALAEQTARELLITSTVADDLELYCEQQSIDILFISCQNKRRELQQWLNRLRELRLPYVFLTDTMQHMRKLHTVLSPITMLEEEVYKAEILTHLARFTAARIILLRANDYGSRALANTNRILTALEKNNLPAETQTARKDSFAVGKEATERQREYQADMLVVTASREYGLDDILFGPQERYVIGHSNAPVMLLNPRADLFSLCD